MHFVGLFFLQLDEVVSAGEVPKRNICFNGGSVGIGNTFWDLVSEVQGTHTGTIFGGAVDVGNIFWELVTEVQGTQTGAIFGGAVDAGNIFWELFTEVQGTHTGAIFGGAVSIDIIQGDQKVAVHLMITIQNVTSNAQIVPRQG